MIKERIEFLEHYFDLYTFWRFEKENPKGTEEYIRAVVSNMTATFFYKNNLLPGMKVTFKLEKRFWGEKHIELIVDEIWHPYFVFCGEKYLNSESLKKRIMELNPYDLVLIVSIKEGKYEEN